MKISIIIPTWNEEKAIGDLVGYLLDQKIEGAIEVIVSDGGSSDNTIAVAEKAGASVVISPVKGRAGQMNYGASIATGDILYFVHADTFPPDSFLKDINKAQRQGYNFGRYQTRFDSNKLLLRINALFTRFDWFVCYGGDQTLFMTKELFDRINGFDASMFIMEDYDIIERAKLLGKYKIMNKAALISARKYESNNWLRVQRANYAIIKMYKAGRAQDEMVKRYKELLS